jgi:hypothetical protein
MDTSSALHQLEAMRSDLFALHSDALAVDATAVAHKAWQAREAITRAALALGELDAACKAYDAPAASDDTNDPNHPRCERCDTPLRRNDALLMYRSRWSCGDCIRELQGQS